MKNLKKIREQMTSDELAQKIAGNIVSGQNKVADYLNEKAKRLSVKTLLFILIGFCTLFGSYLLYVLIRAIS